MSPRTLSKKKARVLSERLREGDTPDPTDIALLGEHLIAFNGALDEVAERLRGIGLTPTTRLKTSGTIIDKLKRQTYLDLNSIRDLAGARVVQRMSLDEQDAVAGQIAALWPRARAIDRRATPSSGYRAMHVVPTVGGCQVEIQVRTLYQDAWAQIMEVLGDIWGRDIRYGGEPLDPDLPVSDDAPQTRSEFVRAWKDLSDGFHTVAQLENELGWLKNKSGRDANEEARMEQLDALVGERFQPTKEVILKLGAVTAALKRDSEGRVVTREVLPPQF